MRLRNNPACLPERRRGDALQILDMVPDPDPDPDLAAALEARIALQARPRATAPPMNM